MKRRGKIPVPEGIYPQEIVRLLGYSLDELRSPSSKRRLADQRRVMACVLRELGMMEWHIGEVLNRKRVSVTAMLRTSYLVEDEVKKAIELIKNSNYDQEKER